MLRREAPKHLQAEIPRTSRGALPVSAVPSGGGGPLGVAPSRPARRVAAGAR